MLAAFATPGRAAMMTGLSYADGYGIFSLGSLTASGGGETGAVAAGGSATFSTYSLGTALSTSSTANSVIVGGAYSQTNGVTNGNVIVGSNATISGPTLNGKLDVAGNVSHSNYGTYNGAITVGGSWTSTGSGLTTASSVKVAGNFTVSGATQISGGLDVRGSASIASPTISGGMRVNGSVTISGSGTGSSVTGGLTYGSTFSGPTSITGSQVSSSAAAVSPAAVPINFSAATTWMQNAATTWGSLTANGTNVLQNNTRTLTGSNTALNVFSLASTDFNFSTLAINVPAGSTVLINVVGTSVTTPSGAYTLNGSSLTSATSGADDGKVLWNFVNASTITMNSFGGSVLAPYATVGFSNGDYVGTLIASGVTSNSGSETYAAFTGSLPSTSGGAPAVPEPSGAAVSLGSGALVLMRRRRSA
jgi:choice-of-anchor A domain-containing protein